MKLRVKLSLMTGGVLLLATVLCIGLSFSMSRRALLLLSLIHISEPTRPY